MPRFFFPKSYSQGQRMSYPLAKLTSCKTENILKMIGADGADHRPSACQHKTGFAVTGVSLIVLSFTSSG
jgi:hypothetical protein